MPTTSKGLWLTLKFFMGALVLILIAAGTAKLLFGNGVAAVAAAILGVLSVLRFSQIADRHSR